MTDTDLIREYNRYKGNKMEFLAARVIKDGDSLARMFRVLQGHKLRPHFALRKIFGTTRPEKVTKEQLRNFAHRRGLLAPQKEPEHLVDGWCRGCMYLVDNYGKACEYINIEKRRRGCPAGAGCTKRKLVKEGIHAAE